MPFYEPNLTAPSLILSPSQSYYDLDDSVAASSAVAPDAARLAQAEDEDEEEDEAAGQLTIDEGNGNGSPAEEADEEDKAINPAHLGALLNKPIDPEILR